MMASTKSGEDSKMIAVKIKDGSGRSRDQWKIENGLQSMKSDLG